MPQDEIGNFYNGDSYIVCKASKPAGSDKLLYNIHFWIGRHSTAVSWSNHFLASKLTLVVGIAIFVFKRFSTFQDEYGTAAYKTVELDTFLDDAAIQHREVEGYESDLFKSYFDKLV